MRRAPGSRYHCQGGQLGSYLAGCAVTTYLERRKTGRFRLLSGNELLGFKHSSGHQDDCKKMLALAVHLAIELG
jgi:hypothetical protein